MRYAYLALALLLTSCGTLRSGVTAHDAYPEVYRISNGKGCSAVAVSPTLLYTAAHCVDDAQPVYVYFGSTPFQAQVVAFDPLQDLAALEMPYPMFWAYAPPYQGELYSGQSLVQVGYGCPDRVRKVAFIGVDWDNELITAGLTCGGDSGGGVFTPDGRLVSITLARHLKKPQGYSRSPW
jgi:hypothetical protein